MHGFKTKPYAFYSCSIVHNVWPCYLWSLISLVFSTFKQPYNLLRSLTWKVETNQADVDEHGNMTADVVGEQVIVRILMK